MECNSRFSFHSMVCSIALCCACLQYVQFTICRRFVFPLCNLMFPLMLRVEEYMVLAMAYHEM